MPTTDIVIVGAGISGLALGRALEEQGYPFRIIEASPRVGGIIRTAHVDGHRLELGPQRLRAVAGLAPFLSVLETLHRPPRLPVMVARGGRLHRIPTTLGGAVVTRALSPGGKLRAAMEPIMAIGHSHTRLESGTSAGDFLRRRLGEEVYRTFAGPLLGGLYGSDPDFMDAHRTLVPAMETLGIGSFLRRMAPGPFGGRRGLIGAPIVVPGGGMEMLPRTMADRLERARPGCLQLGCRVLGVRPIRSTHDSGLRFAVESEAGSITARHVVLTVPAAAAATLLEPFGSDASERLRHLTTNPLALVHLETPRLPPALGFQVAFGEPHRMRGATFSGNLDGSGRSAVVYLGGMVDPDLPDAPDAELGALAEEEFSAITGVSARAIHVHRTGMPAWDRTWRSLDGLRLPDGIHLLTNYMGRPGIVGRLMEAERLATTLPVVRSTSSRTRFQRGGS